MIAGSRFVRARVAGLPLPEKPHQRGDTLSPLTPCENLGTSSELRSFPMKLVQKRSRKTGLPPGTLVHIGEKKTDKVTITAFNYAGTRCDERKDVSLDVLAPPTDESVTWVDVGGVHKMEILESFGKQFQLHPLLLE